MFCAACSTILVVHFGGSIGALPPNIVDTIGHLTQYPPKPYRACTDDDREPLGLRRVHDGESGSRDRRPINSKRSYPAVRHRRYPPHLICQKSVSARSFEAASRAAVFKPLAAKWHVPQRQDP